MDELDLILLDQYHTTKRRLKTVKKLRKIVSYKEDLDRVEISIQQSLIFFETMIVDKSLLNKKHKLKKQTDDILGKGYIKDSIKYVFAYSALSYRMINDFWKNYMSFWKLR